MKQSGRSPEESLRCPYVTSFSLRQLSPSHLPSLQLREQRCIPSIPNIPISIVQHRHCHLLLFCQFFQPSPSANSHPQDLEERKWAPHPEGRGNRDRRGDKGNWKTTHAVNKEQSTVWRNFCCCSLLVWGRVVFCLWHLYFKKKWLFKPLRLNLDTEEQFQD